MKRTRNSPKYLLSLLVILAMTIGMTGFVLANGMGHEAWSGGVSPTTASTISLVSAAGVYGDKTVFTATLMAGTTPLVGKPVFFSLNGKRLGVTWTDTAGVAMLTRSLEHMVVGAYANAVTAFFMGDEVYISSMGTGTLTMTKQDIVITAKNKSRLVGTENPPLTYAISDKVPNDAIEGIALATAATAASPVGTYEITIAGPASTDNYNITYVSGVLSVVETLDIKAIQISGPDTLTIPAAGADLYGMCWQKDGDHFFGSMHMMESRRIAATYKAIATDQNDVVLSKVHVTWSLLAPVAGVRIYADKGIVIVTSDAVAGSFTLVATYNGTITASKTVTLVAPAPVAVTAVVLKKTAITIFAGNMARLSAKVLPRNATNKAVTWASSDMAIATVDTNGKVTGVSVGTAVITVTTADGAFTAMCTVTVLAPIPVTGISFKRDTVTIKVNGHSQLFAMVAPTNATNKKVTWMSSDPLVATVNDHGKATGVSVGTAVITATTVDGTFTATCTVTVEAAASKNNVNHAFTSIKDNHQNRSGGHR
jgi:uncharacterized protein YjdB